MQDQSFLKFLHEVQFSIATEIHHQNEMINISGYSGFKVAFFPDFLKPTMFGSKAFMLKSMF